MTEKSEGRFEPVKLLKAIASLKLTVICLLVLTVLVVWGTLYQADHGLYQAQVKFFHSWVFFIFGFIPFPGTVLTMFVLLINLICSIFFRIGFKWRQIGNIITHTGIIILLVGGGLTFYYSIESSMVLREGETGNMSQSRTDWELAVWEQTGGDIDVYALNSNGFKPGDVKRFGPLGATITVKEYHANCKAFTGRSGETGPVNVSGINVLSPQTPEKEAAQNIAGGVFSIALTEGQPIQVLLYGDERMPTPVKIGNRTFLCSLRKQKIPLPLTLTLKEFKVVFYPNSQIPKSYESTVALSAEGGMERDVVISMNKPLRFADFTFFQSSYHIAKDGTRYSILAVVKNTGRLLPYVSSIIIFLGMLIHFLMMMFLRGKKKDPTPIRENKSQEKN